MIHRFPTHPSRSIVVQVHRGGELRQAVQRLARWTMGPSPSWLSRHPAWLTVLQYGMQHVPFLLEATENGQTVGVLPLAFVRSLLFGRFLVSLPWLNMGGVVATDDEISRRLLDHAVELSDRLHVRYLELRHERYVGHPKLTAKQTHKVHMRLRLPDFPGPLWESFPAKVRNQVRKAQKLNMQVVWGGRKLLPEFYAVLSENMRDLGSPVFPLRLYAEILRTFPEQAELCVVRHSVGPVAAALLLHGDGVTEVPNAGSLRAYNSTCANMLMYWHLLDRAIQRRQAIFDFGRSSPESGTYRFKEQWGAQPEPSVWQYYVRRGQITEMRRDNPKYERMIRMWQHLPLRVSRWLGPRIVRGIP
jgi:FemAB-related protein (PEP-CTERM system-associated)